VAEADGGYVRFLRWRLRALLTPAGDKGIDQDRGQSGGRTPSV